MPIILPNHKLEDNHKVLFFLVPGSEMVIQKKNTHLKT